MREPAGLNNLGVTGRLLQTFPMIYNKGEITTGQEGQFAPFISEANGMTEKLYYISPEQYQWEAKIIRKEEKRVIGMWNWTGPIFIREGAVNRGMREPLAALM